MATLIFSGRVIPERADVSISVPELPLITPGGEFSGKMLLSIICSQILVKLDISDTNINVPTIKNSIEPIVRGLVDAYGYLTGRGYDIEITSVINQTGQYHVFGVEEEALAKIKGERPLTYQELFYIMAKCHQLQRALGDLREAIRVPIDTGFFCYRACECVRLYFEEDTDNSERKSWERLRNNLLIDRGWFTKIEKFAKPQRHGALLDMSGNDRALIMQRAWKVISRFCIYLKDNSKPLSEKEFEVLKET